MGNFSPYKVFGSKIYSIFSGCIGVGLGMQIAMGNSSENKNKLKKVKCLTIEIT